ncbi:MAG: hypothetical protein HOP11_07695 [Saprospiraceae bacterium]|nr:hypothetical protein [Saprospiraceae bacterium]
METTKHLFNETLKRIIISTLLFITCAYSNVLDANCLNFQNDNSSNSENIEYFNISFDGNKSKANFQIIALSNLPSSSISLSIVEDEFGIFLRTYDINPTDTIQVELPLNGNVYKVKIVTEINNQKKETNRTFTKSNNNNLVSSRNNKESRELATFATTTYNNGPLGISTARRSEDALSSKISHIRVDKMNCNGNVLNLQLNSPIAQNITIIFTDVSNNSQTLGNYILVQGNNQIQQLTNTISNSLGVVSIISQYSSISKKLFVGN